VSTLKKSIEFETTFGRYVASEIIGEGGTGKVYKAESDAGQNVAVKVLDPAKSLSAERRGRFKNELLFGTRNQHPNIVTVIDHGPLRVGSSIAPFYVMPLYDSSLRKAMRAGIAPATILTHFSQILDGVEAAHLQRVVHRDLKPENVLFDSGRKQWVIADFGVAEFAEEELYTVVDTKPGTRLANFQYAAPEQRVRGGRTDLRTDIFALGLILNEMFTGAVPLGTGYKTIAAVSPESAYLDELVEAMIRHDPNDRPPSIDAIKQLLIVRHNEFVERQCLSQLRQVVVPVSELDDPIARDPIRVVGLDWERNVLTLTLSQPVNSDWVQAIQFERYGRSSLLGKGPEAFRFQGNSATVGAEERQVQDVVNHFKNWLGPAHQIYVERKKKERREAQERQRRALEQEIQERERRARVLSGVKI
jgi:serine/threonine protein kinase